MRIGIFTDTYFPQVSGVATSIKTLKTELEKLGHTVFIFTTTDKNVNRYEDWQIVRIPSVPFFAFKDRQIAYAGFTDAVKIAKRYHLDIIHTQTEFSLGILGKMIARELKIPVIHTYHTNYEDYVHYLAKGRIIRPGMVKYIVRSYCTQLDGLICPSAIVEDMMAGYKVNAPKRVIPTGIELEKFRRPELTQEDVQGIRDQLGIADDEVFLLSLSRVSYEKNIQAVIQAMPLVLAQGMKAKLVVAGDGPYLPDLKALVTELGLEDTVQFTGMIAPGETALYYKAADFFVSASTSETQGLTYLEALATGTPIIAHTNPYLKDLISDRMFGTLYSYPQDLADAIVDAIIATPEMTPQALEDKLYDISAENFGRQVATFYLDTIMNHEVRKANGELAPIPVVIARKATKTGVLVARKSIYLPKRILVKSTVRSRRFIRDFRKSRDS
ncbi:glycosyltransferase family 4 protein [Streptococcus moroccensis]|uniref:1,2-diacylglycerol 3-alpha-glucosyltransferase n=1 Tax=Streptococcus moroccensis TaxID=1451356 RepID=A0ABT9YPF7_9STRE|nr:glycosyltransferase family 4 protein [Streptococcus moroccensis]MDQ0221878.1 1,2-diacylglycerol 3-alpha-glucosyltransferase [Streptococcus moroccensis]